ncbi:MAG: hypothetical protein ABI147_00795 [Acidobacteriaceae bacterium]
MFGLTLCALLLFFAVGAKTAVYHQHQSQVKALTSAKVWENDRTASAVPTPSLPTTVLVSFSVTLFALAAMVLGPRQLRFERQPVVPASRRSWPDLAVRPPPSI